MVRVRQRERKCGHQSDRYQGRYGSKIKKLPTKQRCYIRRDFKLLCIVTNWRNSCTYEERQRLVSADIVNHMNRDKLFVSVQ